MTTDQDISNAEQVEIEVTDTPEPDDIEIDLPDNEADPQEEGKSEPKKTERVEFNTPEQEARFSDVYKQMKQSDNRNKMLTEFLMEQQKQLDELKNRFSQTDEADAEAVIMNKLRVARENGDDHAQDLAIKELVSFRTQAELSKNSVKKQAAPAQIDPDEQYIANLMEEKDHNGQFVRPFLREDHPDHEKAIQQLAVLAYKYKNDPYVLQKSLADLDKVMRNNMTEEKPPANNPPAKRTPNPMQGSNLTNQKPRATIKMTQAEINIAKKLGIDPKKYAAQRDAIKKGSK